MKTKGTLGVVLALVVIAAIATFQYCGKSGNPDGSASGIPSSSESRPDGASAHGSPDDKGEKSPSVSPGGEENPPSAETNQPGNKPERPSDENREPEDGNRQPDAPDAPDGPDSPPELEFKIPDPTGPDELFVDLSTEGLTPQPAPKALHHFVVLKLPSADSVRDDCIEDLEGDAKLVATAFELSLQQRLDYMPQLVQELGLARAARFNARLRFADMPGRGAAEWEKAEAESMKIAILETAAVRFGVGYVFVIGWTKGETGAPAGRVMRYRQGAGVERAIAFDLPAVDEPESGSAAEFVERRVAELCEGTAAVSAATPVVPPLVNNDRALRKIAELHLSALEGKLTSAWYAFEELAKADPKCARSALIAMEVFASLALNELDEDERARLYRHALEFGIRAVAAAPMDAVLRGQVAYNGYSWYFRREWGIKGLDQALKIQPHNWFLLTHRAMLENPVDRDVQVNWISERALGKVDDGSIEYHIGNIRYGSGDYLSGMEWYRKATVANPAKFEYWLSIGLSGYFHAKALDKQAKAAEEPTALKKEALQTYELCTKALWRSLSLDPTEIDYQYEFYARNATADLKELPLELEDINRLYLVMAARSGLHDGGDDTKLGRVLAPLVEFRRVSLREDAKEAKPKDPLYELKLMARMRFAVIDGDREEGIETIREMHRFGHRSGAWDDGVNAFGRQ